MADTTTRQTDMPAQSITSQVTALQAQVREQQAALTALHAQLAALLAATQSPLGNPSQTGEARGVASGQELTASPERRSTSRRQLLRRVGVGAAGAAAATAVGLGPARSAQADFQGTSVSASDTHVGVYASPNGVARPATGVGDQFGVLGTIGPGALAPGNVVNAGVAGYSDGFAGVAGRSNTGAGVAGIAPSGIGVNGNSTSGSGVVGASGSGLGVLGVSSTSAGVYGQASTQAGTWGLSTSGPGTGGNSTSGFGLYGVSLGNDGVRGFSTAGLGVHGISSSSNGVYGEGGGANAGVAGIGTSGPGVFAQSTSGTAMFALTTSGTGVYGTSSSGLAGWFVGPVQVNGAFTVVGGPKSAAVPHPDGSHRRLYCVESPESWFEDFGRDRLVNGRGRVRLDPDFAAVVHSDNYDVVLTAEGDHKGLFVSNKTPQGFEVQECQGGTSTVPFTYRVVAKRKDVVGPRLERVTVVREAPPTPVRATSAAPDVPVPPPPPPVPPGAPKSHAAP